MADIIFGANGQDGYYLNKLLLEKQCEVIGVSRAGSFLHTDITDYRQVGNLIKEYSPDRIFHLAANSSTRHETLFENHATIATGTINILEAVKNFSPHSKVFISGSGLQFKNESSFIKETDVFEARDAYSVSRIQSVFAARYYRSLGIKAYVGYFFNHDSPRRTEKYISKRIASAAKRISKGSAEKIEIGDMTVVREWTYADDIVKGLLQFILQDDFFEANISSGIGFSVEEWVKECFDILGMDYKEHIIKNDNFKTEYKRLVSDATLIKSLGFRQEVSFKQLAKMMIDE